MIIKGWRWDLVVTCKPWVCMKSFSVSFAGLYVPIAWYSEACLNHFQYIYFLGTPISHGDVCSILMEMLSKPNWDLQEKLGSHFNVVWAYQQHCVLDRPQQYIPGTGPARNFQDKQRLQVQTWCFTNMLTWNEIGQFRQNYTVEANLILVTNTFRKLCPTFTPIMYSFLPFCLVIPSEGNFREFQVGPWH